MTEGLHKEKQQHDIDAEAFLATYKAEVLSILDDPDERMLVEKFSREPRETLSNSDEQRLTDILERFETKIFDYEKADANPDAKRVLVTSDNPGSWSAIRPLIGALEQDPRCRGVIAIVSGVAGKQFTDAFPMFNKVHNEQTVLGDAILIADKKPIDVVIGSTSVKNGPEDLALFGGKGNLGAAKTYLLFEGYGGVGGAFNLGTTNQMEEIDGIFCNDTFAKALVHKLLPEYPQDHIHATGMLASEGFELDKAEQYRIDTRARLGIRDQAFAILYIGDVSSDYANMPGANTDINTETFEKTLGAIENFAKTETEKEIALIVRPHPRDPDKEKLVNAGERGNVSGNLAVKNGSNPIPFNGVVYASDVIVSIISNENIFAPARGRRSVFLAYDEPGFGGQALQSSYGPDLIDAIKQMPGVFIAQSPQELVTILAHISKEPTLTPRGNSVVATGILDTVLK